MAFFTYEGRDKRGNALKGELESHNRETAVGELLQQGITLIRIAEKKATASKNVDIHLFKTQKITEKELVLFTRQLYALTKAGIPIVRALKGIAESSHNDKLRQVLNDVSLKLISGADLASSLKTHESIFSSVYISMVHIGESTGRLDNALERLIEHLETERVTRERIKAAMRYPLIVVSAIVIATVVIMVFVVPNFSAVFEKLGSDLPVATLLLIATSNFFINWWPVLTLGLASAFFLLRETIKTEQGRLGWDRFKLKIPLLGSIFERVALSRFSRSFSMMLAAGVPILNSLKIISGTLDNLYIGQAIDSMGDGIERGESVTQTASATGLFTPLILQMLAVGEETGAIDTLLDEVADFYEQEVDYELKQLSDAIEPILLVFLGALIVLLALGVFLPVWELSGAVKN